MRKFILILLLSYLFIFPLLNRTIAAPFAAPILVQSVSHSAASTTFNTVTLTATTAGNSIIARFVHSDVRSVSSIKVPLGGVALTQAVTGTVSGVSTDIYYLHNIAAGSVSARATLSGSTDSCLVIEEWSGLNNAAPDGTNSNTGIATSTVTSGSVTPATSNNVVFAVGGWTANDYSSGPTNGFTRTGTGLSLTLVSMEDAVLIQSSATAQSTGWTLTTGVNWAVAIAIFGAPGSSGPTASQSSSGFFMQP